ncbi:MAG: hypothetical protein HY774_06440 [Acidobacteria bacterium]|nr:hypothetical protein [Acidobacteriota bacterium]
MKSHRFTAASGATLTVRAGILALALLITGIVAISFTPSQTEARRQGEGISTLSNRVAPGGASTAEDLVFEPRHALADVLNADGTINITKGKNGNFDASGYRLVSGPQDEPRFVPNASGNFANQRPTGGSFAAQAGNVIYDTTHASNQGAEITAAANGPATSMGDVIVLGGTDRAICQIQIELFTLASTAPFDLTMSLYTDCSTNGAGNSPCGNGVGTLIPGSVVTVNNVTPPALGTIFPVTFPYPNVDVSSEVDNTISVVVNASRSDVFWRIGETPVVGSQPDAAPSFVTRCGSTAANNGCQRNFGLTNNFSIQIQATAVGGTGTCANGTINGIAVDSVGNIYVGGTFTELDTLPLSRVAMWNGTAWEALGDISALTSNGVDNNVNAVVVDSNDNVYVGGTFQQARNNAGSTVPTSRVAMWNGTTWSALGDAGSVNDNGVNNAVQSLALESNDNLLVGGNFTEARTNAGTKPLTSRFARWNGTMWSAFGDGTVLTNNGVGNPVSAIAVGTNGDIFIGGNFTQARNGPGSTVPTARVARWNGSVWSALGDGSSVNNNGLAGGGVNSIVVGTNGDVFIGFASSNLSVRTNGSTSVPASRVARWDGSAWFALGDPTSATTNGVDFDVAKMARIGNNLFVGGRFTQARNSAGSTVPTAGIAMWDGTTWTALGDGSALGNNGIGPNNPTPPLGSAITGLGVDGTTLLVGGDFDEARTDSTNILETENLAAWTGTAWIGVSSCPDLVPAVPPTLAKNFSPNQIPVGTTSTLTFTLSNSNTIPLTGVGFTDTLPTGLVVATPNGLTSTCSGGTVTAVEGTQVITFSGGTLPAMGTCTFSVDVLGTTAGVYTNTTEAITSIEGGTGSTASAMITVVGPPTLTKAFEPDTILLTQTSVLTFTMSNGNPTVPLTGISFTDTLPDGVIVATPASVMNTCSSGTVTAVEGSSMITFSGGTLAPNTSCSFSVTVQGITYGEKVNTTSTISSVEGGTGAAAMATLIVQPTVELATLYVPDTVNNRVQKFDGNVWSQVGPVGLFKTPEAVTADPFGQRIYVADTGNNRLEWSTDGGVTWALFASIGSGLNQVRAPQGLALDPDGNLYVADTGNNRVTRFDGGVPGFATVLLTNGSTLTQVRTPHGLAVDTAFNLFVADYGNNRILRVAGADQPGPVVTLVASLGSASNQVRQPQGVGVDNAGNLYVADTGNNRVLQFAGGNPGPATVLATIGSTLGKVRLPEGVTVNLFTVGPLAGISFLSVGDTANNRIVGRPVDTATWQLVGAPNNVGSAIGQFRSPSKIR